MRVASQNAFRVPNGAHFKVVAEQQARALAAQDELQMRLIRVNRPHGESAAEEFVDPARRGPNCLAAAAVRSSPILALAPPPRQWPQRPPRNALLTFAPFVAPPR